ncbi:peptidase C15 [Bifidobacterium aemilianum]|uniref:Pyroglutamyl-peptidase I n=1 Tax=Bifidobacterium aemilianum TaxID=2493120 RepID=A0A366K908_9BIFI|nr:pyroglutamyl-peptidase I [Bifidobacterium aemilianum]RBP97613.1 peptidase C15 [Bifidobacterium aemilianum]
MQEIKVVISGFNPYEGIKVNPSYEVPKAIAERGLLPLKASDQDFDDPLADVNLTINSVSLPISFEDAWSNLQETIEATQADIIIATGLKRAARGMLLERCATNLMDRIAPAQNGIADGSQPITPIKPEGPAAYWTRLPLHSIMDDFNGRGIPATLSSDAGTFVCNSLFYNLLDWTAGQKHKLAGFLSFPIVNESAHSQHGLPLDQQIQACSDLVRQTVRYYLQPSSGAILLS